MHRDYCRPEPRPEDFFRPGPAEEGRKFDQDKPPLHLFPFDALLAMGAVLGYGEKKYGSRNWEGEALSAERLIGASLRHIAAHMNGEKLDESGHSHLAHAATSLSMALAKELRNGGA